MGLHLRSEGRSSGVVVREAGSNTKGLGFDSRVRHGCQTIRPRLHQWLSGSVLKIRRPEMPG